MLDLIHAQEENAKLKAEVGVLCFFAAFLTRGKLMNAPKSSAVPGDKGDSDALRKRNGKGVGNKAVKAED